MMYSIPHQFTLVKYDVCNRRAQYAPSTENSKNTKKVNFWFYDYAATLMKHISLAIIL